MSTLYSPTKLYNYINITYLQYTIYTTHYIQHNITLWDNEHHDNKLNNYMYITIMKQMTMNY